jgi:hypothetical protein
MQKCLIPIRLGNCKARALLDSGSTISAIHGNLFQKSEFASLPLKTPKVPHIIGAGGATHPIQGQIDLQFSIGGLLLSQTFYVIPTFRQSMILGTDFLQKNEACLDWQNNISNNTNIPELNIRFNDESVELVDNHKHLGVTFVSDGNWTVHIENIARSALKQVNVLRKLKFILSKQALSNIYRNISII